MGSWSSVTVISYFTPLMVTFIHSVVENARWAVSIHSPVASLAENRLALLTDTAVTSPERPRADRISDMATDLSPCSTYSSLLYVNST